MIALCPIDCSDDTLGERVIAYVRLIIATTVWVDAL